MLKRYAIYCLVVILHIVLVSGCVSTSSKKASPSERAEAHVNLAAEYFRMGRMESALKAAKKAVAADIDSASANSLLALIYQRLEFPSLAEEYFDNAIELLQEDEVEYSITHNNYGVFLCQQDQLLDAEEHFLLAANNKLYATPQNAYENAAICALKGSSKGNSKRNSEEKAEKYFRKALELAPNMPRSLFEMAFIQYDAEKFLSSRAYLQRYHAVSRGNSKSLFLAMKAEWKLGASKEAQQIKSKLKARFPDSEEAKSLKD